jgi:hypothetical protein
MPLTEKEKDFCKLYARLGNHREAAAKSGYAFPEKAGARLLGKVAVIDQIEHERETLSRIADAADGLRRLSFGSVADAVKLLFSGSEISDIESLDLYMVSEIKFSKSGGVEIKFFDRLKALQALSEISGAEIGGTAPFIDAIYKGAAAINSPDRGSDDEL